MVALAQLRGAINVIHGGPKNELKSHILVWDNRNACFAEACPSMLGTDSFEVILAGKFTPAQDLALRQRHRCDPNVSHKMLIFLRAINPLYEKVPATAVEDKFGESNHYRVATVSGNANKGIR
jgi:hypothetical protein